MWGLRYLTAFAIGTVVGVLNEFFQKPDQPCYSCDPSYSCTLTCGAANVYGWCAVAMSIYFDVAKAVRAPTALTLLLIGPLLTICEAVAGAISGAYFGEQRWKYPPHYLPAYKGYVSLVSGLYFTVAGIVYYLFYTKALSKI